MKLMITVALLVLTVLFGGKHILSQNPLSGYDRVDSLSGGWSRVMEDGKWFHIRPDGERAYEESYDWVDSFIEDRAWVVKDGMEFHIRPDGSRAYAESYDIVGPFHQGIAWVVKDGESSYIRPDGSRIR